MILPAVSFAAGIFFCAGPLWAVLCLGALALLPSRVRLLAVLAFCGVLGGWFAERARPGPAPELDAESGETVALAGCIAGAVVSDGIQTRFPLELERGARALVTLTAAPGETLPVLSYGQLLEATAKVRKPRNFGNPGAFDYVSYLRHSDVYWLASARGVNKVRVMPGVCGTPVRRAALGVREWLVARIRAITNDDLMPALLVGDNFSVDRAQTAEFRRTGTYHAIVVSGLHISVVAGTALLIMRLLRVPLTALVLFGTVLAWLYAAVADWQAPVVRSAVGFTLFLTAKWFFRRGKLLNLLAVTAMVLLAVDPASLYDPSFQLTFLSVGAIAGLAVPVAEATFAPCRDGQGPRGRQFRCEMALVAETLRVPSELLLRAWTPVFWVVELMCVSACVQLALLVPSIGYFHQVSLTSVLANVVVVPALSAAVPVGLAAAATGWRWLAVIAGGLVALGRYAASFWASVETAGRIPDSPAWVGGGLLASTVLLSVSLWRSRGRAATGAVAALVAGFAWVAIRWETPIPPGLTELNVIDVGQGDSLLVVLPDGRTLLVDAGGIPSFDPRLRSRMDIGEDVVSPYLWRRGLRHLDYVAVTHLHDDHAGGLPAVIRNFRPREVWTGLAPESSPLLKQIQEAARGSGSRVRSLRAGEVQDGIRVLWPVPGAEPGAVAKNDDSLVLLISNRKHKFLLMGDAEERAETGIAAPEDVDVLKAGHHGSKTSSTTGLLERTRPLFAAISAGEGNSYGHPNPAVLDRLRMNGVRVMRTDSMGLIQFQSDGTRLNLLINRE